MTNHPDQNRRILVVDDNQAIHTDLKKILCKTVTRVDDLNAIASELLGVAPVSGGFDPFEIDSAYQGEEALEMARQADAAGRPYAMAFLDVRMPPGMDGVQTAAKLWELSPDLQIVICTAYSDYSWDELSSKLNNSDQLLILKKPFDTIEVLQLAKTLTRKWCLQQQARTQIGGLKGMVDKGARALQESEYRYQSLFRSNPLPMWVYDVKTLRFLSVNDTAIAHYGFTLEEFLAMDIRQIRRPEQVPPLLQFLEKTSGNVANRFVTKHRKKDGSEIDVEIISRPIDFDGVKSRLVLASDITEKKLLEMQFLRAQRLEGIGTLATGIAHDLNNILTPIGISAGSLRYSLNSEEQENAVSCIEASVKRGAEIIRQVLTFGRGMSGHRTAVGPAELLREVTRIIREIFPRNIKIASETDDQLWSVTGDRTQLHQVLLNLCINARDAMPKGGHLILRARNFAVDEHCAHTNKPLQPGPHVRLQVADSGCGISPADLPRVFDPFFTTKELGKGTGLGLSTVLGIVQSHGGRVSVESRVNYGTIFDILLPAAAEKPAGNVPPVQKSELRGKGETILLVDDEISIITGTQRILEKNGYRVLSANSGEEAVSIFNRDPSAFSAVVTDIVMPGLDGLALIRQLRNNNPSLRIIACSGLGKNLGGTDQASELESLNVNGFLAKPYTPENLLSTLKEVLHSDFDKHGFAAGGVN